MTIYYYGCRCGSVGRQLRWAQEYAIANGLDLNIINSKYGSDDRDMHRYYLHQANISTDAYRAIVVTPGNVIALNEWNP